MTRLRFGLVLLIVLSAYILAVSSGYGLSDGGGFGGLG